MPVPLRLYAQTPARRAGQICLDAVVLAWAVVWIWVATLVHRGMITLASAGFQLRDGAGGVASNLGRAGSEVRQAPLIGGTLAAPLGSAGSAAGQVADAGRQFGDRLTGASLVVAVAIAVAGALPVLIPWLTCRWRYARRAGSTAALVRRPGGQRLLALRALTGRPTARLLAVHDDPVTAWDEGDPEVTAALAALELRALGLRPARASLVDAR